MSTFGSSSLKMTLLMPLIVLLVPGAVAAKLLGVEDQIRSSVGAFKTSPRVVLVLGVVLVAVAAAAGWYGYGKANQPPPFQMTTQPGVLIENDLPGPVAEVYRKHNVAVASPPVVLSLNTSADVEPYFITASVSGIFGCACLLVGALTAARQRRLPQT